MSASMEAASAGRWLTDRALTLIGNPASRRTATFMEAAQRLGGWRIDVVSYLDVLRGTVAGPACGSLVRLDSPGECAATTRAILQAGIEPLARLGGAPLQAAEIDRLECARGEILSPRQWYLGYRRVLEELSSRWADRELQWTSTPASVATAFDKIACLERWSSVGLPTPFRYDGISSYEELKRRFTDRRQRLFLKLRYGYSAIGAVAFERHGARVRAITTVETVRENDCTRLFVTKKPQLLYDEAEIAWLVDALGREEIVVEDWLPKARWHGVPFDLRIVAVKQRVQHVVGRANSSPFTNLNLDAQRIDRDDVVQHLGDAWPEVESLAERAAARLPEASMLGLDLLVRPCRRRFAVLEANAFGDYLPGLLFNGRSTYESQLLALSTPPTFSASPTLATGAVR